MQLKLSSIVLIFFIFFFIYHLKLQRVWKILYSLSSCYTLLFLVCFENFYLHNIFFYFVFKRILSRGTSLFSHPRLLRISSQYSWTLQKMLNLWLALLGRRNEERLLKGWMFFYVTSFKQTHDLRSWSGLKNIIDELFIDWEEEEEKRWWWWLKMRWKKLKK